jgi:hypothetical protein
MGPAFVGPFQSAVLDTACKPCQTWGFMAVTVDSTVMWALTTRSSEITGYFGGTYSLHLQI